jgi:predicted acyltransferase
MTLSPSLPGNTLPSRYLALDVFRGLTIALMVVVNTPGSWNHLYSPLAHAAWHGFTITDLVFPTFLFVVGNAMSFSMKALNQMEPVAFFKKITKRAAIIFLIGWGLNAFPFVVYGEGGNLQMIDWTAVRFFGVLQRIALCYFLAAIVLYYLGKRGAAIVGFLILLLYWGLMFTFGDMGDPYSLKSNAALKLDLWLLPAKNLYRGEGIPFDPEGLLSTLPAMVNVIGGYIAGFYLQRKGNTPKAIKFLVITSLVLIVVSLLWNPFFPINKKIWTSSYVLLTIGIDCLILGLLVLIIEIWMFKKWTYPVEVFGRNPLILYMLSGMVIKIFYMIRIGNESLKSIVYETLYTSWLSPKNASIIFALSYMLLIWLIGYWMDRKKIYVKV